MTTTQEGLQALAQRILDDARRQGETIIEEGEAHADLTITQAREEIETTRAQILADAEERAASLRRQAASSARVEAKRVLLAKREELINRTFERAWQQLLQPRPPEQYAAVLRRLTVEGAARLGGGMLEIRVNSADRSVLSPETLRTAEDELRQSGIKANLYLAEQTEAIAGGVIIAKDGGRMVFDNSFEGRLERMKDRLRLEVWQMLSAGQAADVISPEIRRAA